MANSSRRYCTDQVSNFRGSLLSNIQSLLFDDVLWAKKAREEHDAFAQAMRDKGVKVHLFGDLLADVLSLDAGRAFVLDSLCTDDQIGPVARQAGSSAS